MSQLKEVWIAYRSEREGWWAESEQLPGWTAAGDTFDEVRAIAREGVVEFAGEEVLIREEVPFDSQSSGALLFREVASPGTSSQGVTFGVSVYIVPQWQRQLPGIGKGKLVSDDSLPLLPQVVRSR